jgi:hypothetical protein
MGVPLAQLLICWSAIAVLSGIVLIMSMDRTLALQHRFARQLGIACKHHGCTRPRWHAPPHLHLMVVERRETGSFRRVA